MQMPGEENAQLGKNAILIPTSINKYHTAYGRGWPLTSTESSLSGQKHLPSPKIQRAAPAFRGAFLA